MSKNVEIVKISADVFNLDGLGNVVDSVTIVEAVNQHPACYLSLHPKNNVDKVQKALPVEQMIALGAYQEDRIQGVSPGDAAGVIISIEGADADSSSSAFFRGIPLSPDIALAVGTYNMAVSLVHRVTNINGLQPYIYGPVQLQAGDLGQANERGDKVPILADKTTASGPVFVQRFRQILKDRMENFDKYGGSWYDDTTGKFVKDIHEKNNVLFKILDSIADDSTEHTYLGIGSLINRPTNKGLGILNIGINSAVADYLTMGGEDFMSIILAMCDATQSFYQPPSVSLPASTYGRIRPFRIMFGDHGPPVAKDVVATYLNFSERSHAADPVTNILITGVPYRTTGTLGKARADNFFIPYQNYQTFHKIDNAYDGGGKGMTIPLPSWLPQRIMEREVSMPDSTLGNKRDVSKYRERKREDNEELGQIYERDYRNILDEYGMNVLSSVQMAPFSAHVRTKLDFSWTPGERYNLSILRGDDPPVKIEGFLYKVTHDVKVASGSPSSMTSLEFNYVKFDAQ